MTDLRTTYLGLTLRNPLLVHDVGDFFKGSGFGRFASMVEEGQVVRAVAAPETHEKSRKFFDEMNSWAQSEGFPGLGYATQKDGVFGGPMSTPIINPPQSAVLGLHRIEDRPVVRNGEIVIRPMMYLAMSYDHRLIDGREAVTFLKTIKEAIEDPTRLLIDL